jgi:hypothetical protein
MSEEEKARVISYIRRSRGENTNILADKLVRRFDLSLKEATELIWKVRKK